MTVPGNERPEAAAGGGHFRASRADRERTIELLKTAFVDGRLTKDAFDRRVDQVFVSRTYAELAVVASDLPIRATAGRPAAAGQASAAGRTLARAVRRSGACLLAPLVMIGIMFGIAAMTNRGAQGMLFLSFFSVVTAVIAASGVLGYGIVDAWRQHRSGGQLPAG